MNLTRYIIRGLFVLLTGIILLYLERMTDDNVEKIAKFKFETLATIAKDSLDSKDKFDRLNYATIKFSGLIHADSSNVRQAFQYLIGLVGLLVVFELIFFATKRKNETKKT